MNRKSKHHLLFTFLIFLYIYIPPIFIIDLFYVLGPLSIVILFLKYQNEAKIIILTKPVFIFLIGVIASLIMLFTTILFTTKVFNNTNQILTILLLTLPCAMLLIILLKKHDYNTDDLVKLLLNAALIQAVLAILIFLIPSFKSLILNLFYQAYLVDPTLSYWSQYRVNGLARNLMFAAPVTQGFLAALAFWFYLHKSSIYSIYVPIILFSAVINARTGLIVFILCLLIILILDAKNLRMKLNVKILTIAIFSLLILPMFFSGIENKSPFTSEWIKGSILETTMFLKGENVGYYDAANNMLFFPPLQDIFIGTGKHHFFEKYKSHASDIGYVNDLFLGGLFFVICYYASFFYLFYL